MYIVENITMEEFRKYLRVTKTIVFPFGTIEEHGRHLPLNTDSFIIQEALKTAAKRRKFFLAPVLPYGVCTTTKDHPGTLGISPVTLRSFTRDLVTEAYRKGLRNFLLVSGHGGSLHMSALKEVGEDLIERLRSAAIAVFSPYDLLWKEFSEIAETPNDSHAGELETSMILFLAKNMVRGSSPKEYPLIPKPFVVKNKTRYWKGGVWGDPGKASSKKGERAMRLIADKIVDVLDKMEGRV